MINGRVLRIDRTRRGLGFLTGPKAKWEEAEKGLELEALRE